MEPQTLACACTGWKVCATVLFKVMNIANIAFQTHLRKGERDYARTKRANITIKKQMRDKEIWILNIYNSLKQQSEINDLKLTQIAKKIQKDSKIIIKHGQWPCFFILFNEV